MRQIRICKPKQKLSKEQEMKEEKSWPFHVPLNICPNGHEDITMLIMYFHIQVIHIQVLLATQIKHEDISENTSEKRIKYGQSEW